jgi:predicted permease
MRWLQWLGLGRFARHQREDEVEREIHAHLELEAEEQREAGLAAADANAAARRAFGNATLIREELRAVWGTPWLDTLLQDVRYALRTMRRAPAFTAITVGSSAVGIGACVVVFAVLNVAMLKPLQVVEPERLLSISEHNRRTGEIGNELSYPDFLDLRLARSFESVAACDPLLAVSIEFEGDPQRHWGALVTANYFDVIEPGFAVGRGFDATRDDTRGETPVVVLNHTLWQRRFGSDSGIVGRLVLINKRPATVIGVTKAGFHGTDVGITPEFWIPFSMIDEVEARKGRITENRQRHWLSAVARLRPGVDAAAARGELDVIASTLNSKYDRTGQDRGRQDGGFHLERAGQIHPALRRMSSTMFSLAMCTTVLVLLTACGNVANLLLGRASARRREIAARMALGASRGRLVRQLLIESLLLALLGGCGGLLLAAYATSLTGIYRVPLGWPLDITISLDGRVMLFCAGLSIATALAFGLVPALRATKPDVLSDLKAHAPGGSLGGRFSLRNGLVVTQVAICTLLLLGTGLFLRSLHAARQMDLGLGHRELLLLAFDPSLDRRPDAQARLLLRDILERAQTVPGVKSATLTTGVPLTFIVDNSNFVAAERATDPGATRTRTDIYGIGPRFFETMGIAFVGGEDFSFARASDGAQAIVNDAFARAVFPDQPAIGRRILGDGKALDIVGIVATAKSRTIGEAARPTIYLPLLDTYSARQSREGGITLVVRTKGPVATYTEALREVIRRADPSLAVFDVRTMESVLRDALIVPRMAWTLSSVSGSIGLALATVGLYGVVTFAVARRRREIGIRLAIGARPGEILAMILRHGAALAFAGTALGFVLSLSVAHFAASLLYGVSPADPLTFIGVPVFLMVIALLACTLPARAAARLDPVDVLRTE